MRYDLEIGNLYTDIAYIYESSNIPSSVTPLYYLNIDTRDKIPSDFISVQNNALLRNLSGLTYQMIQGPNFESSGDKFNITHVSTYSVNGKAKIPLFYKHVIDKKISEDAIKITDYFGIQIPKEEYLVEEKENHTNIYINKYNKILFVTYVIDNSLFKRLLDLQPIFSEAGWTDLVTLNNNIPEYKYIISDNYVQTSYSGTLYVSYTHETNLLRLPTCNIEDDWFIGILNTSFTIDKYLSGNSQRSTYKYSVPEYYVQQLGGNVAYKEYTEVKAKKLFNNYIQLQNPIMREKSSSIKIYIYDFYTKSLIYAISTDNTLTGKLYKDGVYWLYTDDWNGDGVIGLPVSLKDREVAFATYYTYNDYYEFKFLNFNSPTLNQGCYFGIWILPNATEGEEAVYFSRIGLQSAEEVPKGKFMQGMQFKDVATYNDFINNNNLYSIAIISVSSSYEASTLDTKDARIIGGSISNRKAASESTIDMLYSDIINKNIIIPTNDTIVAAINMDAIQNRDLVNINADLSSIGQDDTAFLDKVKNTIQHNLDASSYVILDGEYVNVFSQIVV